MVRRLLAVLLATFVAVSSARAADCPDPDAKPPTAMESLNKGFADWVVGPMAKVMFFDVVLWDNKLPVGEMPASEPPADEAARDAAQKAELERKGQELVGYVEGEGYQYRCRLPAHSDELVPVIEAGTSKTYGRVSVELIERNGKLLGRVQPKTLDLVALGIEVPEDLPEDAPPLTLENDAIAPFPIEVDPRTGDVQPTEVELDWADVPLVAGMRVRQGDQLASLVAVKGSKASLEVGERWTDATPLANPKDLSVPIVVVWLVFGAVFFTLRYAFINLRGFGHAVLVTAGRYDHDDDPGEVSHFQALSSALSATVGLGNIAGVAIAVNVGGPGAIFWMVIAGFLGMSSKFAECSLGQMYRTVRPDGTVSGGPMHYLADGLAEIGMGPMGKVLAVVFALMCIGGSLGGGNMFQGNQSFQALADEMSWLEPSSTGTVELTLADGVTEVVVPAGLTVSVPGGPAFSVPEETKVAGSGISVPVVAVVRGPDGNVDAGRITSFDPDELAGVAAVSNTRATAGGASYALFYGIALAFAVGLVIIGGIKRIGSVAGAIVPLMCGIYVLAGLYIIAVNASAVPGALATIVSSAFTAQAGIGGGLGIALVQGFRRAAFSNEAGVGSASIAHSAAATNEPVREGIVALLEPFIDTIIVCTMTGLVVVVTGVYADAGAGGITMTSKGFSQGGLTWFPLVLAAAVTLFAFSTMISWSYYGERCAGWLFGDWARMPYKVLFLTCAVLGPVFTMTSVLDFSDLMILGMAFPNILGVMLLSGKVKKALDDYLARLRKGEFETA